MVALSQGRVRGHCAQGGSPGCPHHHRHPRPVEGRRAAGPGPGAQKPTCRCSPGAQRQSCGRWLCGATLALAACLAGQRSSWPPAPGSPCGDGHCPLDWPAPLPSSPPHPGSPGPPQTTGTSAPHLGSFALGWGRGQGCCGWSACWPSCLLRSRGCAESCGRWAGAAEKEWPQPWPLHMHPSPVSLPVMRSGVAV